MPSITAIQLKAELAKNLPDSQRKCFDSYTVTLSADGSSCMITRPYDNDLSGHTRQATGLEKETAQTVLKILEEKLGRESVKSLNGNGLSLLGDASVWFVHNGRKSSGIEDGTIYAKPVYDPLKTGKNAVERLAEAFPQAQASYESPYKDPPPEGLPKNALAKTAVGELATRSH